MFGIDVILATASVAGSAFNTYGNIRLLQEVVFGNPLKKRMDEIYSLQQANSARLDAMQRVNHQLLYATSMNSLYLKDQSHVLPEFVPSKAILERLARPAKTIVDALNDGKPQPILGSAVMALPAHLSSFNARFIFSLDNFLHSDLLFPPDPDRIGAMLFRAGDQERVGILYYSDLAHLGLGLHQQWQYQARQPIPGLSALEKKAIQDILGVNTVVVREAAATDFALEKNELQHPLKSGGKGPILLPIKPGEFFMGSDDGHDREKPRHRVKIGYAFAMGKYPVTFDEYDIFCEATERDKPKDEGWGRGRRPVINISWGDAVAYCEWLSAETGQAYRLPSEAEWEYVCRAGTTSEYSFGDVADKLPDYAWYDENSSSKTQPVGKKKPNPWGLYDMHGNVWEWCLDSWHENYQGAPDDGTSWEGDSPSRLQRGGSWYGDDNFCRSACRDNCYDVPYDFNGVRVVCGAGSARI